MQATYFCKSDALTQKKPDKNSENFKKYIGVYADTFGFKANTLKVQGGDKAELIPDERSFYLKSSTYPRKIVFDIRRIGKNLAGVFTAEYLDSLIIQYLARKSLVPDSLQERSIRKVIEDLADVKKGDCELQ